MGILGVAALVICLLWLRKLVRRRRS